MGTETYKYLTPREARRIKDQYERDFALRVLAAGCVVFYQIPVGASVIDFLIINPKRSDGSEGILVEITHSEKMTARKYRQKEAMIASGMKSVLLMRENLNKIFS